jgi:hypothetical protein
MVTLTLTPEDARFLHDHLRKHIAEMDLEVVHTDKRELQRALSEDVDRLRAIESRVRAALAAPR